MLRLLQVITNLLNITSNKYTTTI